MITMPQIKVSVLMPSLNVEPYIRQCLESVAGQTMAEIEMICIDAGSTDGTAEILEEYANKDTRITVIHSDKRSYGYQINLGIAAARGEYIGIVETDDYISPEMYEELYQAAVKAENPDVVKSGYFDIKQTKHGGSISVKLPIRAKTGEVFPITKQYYLLWGHPSVWACIYRRAFLNEKSIRMMEVPGAGWVDNPFLFRTMCEADRICWVNKPFYYYRDMNPNSSSILKNCAIPIDRINDIKDYLDEKFPDDRKMEQALFQRAVNYTQFILKNPNLTKENKEQIGKMLRRFRPETICGQPFRWGYKKAKGLWNRLHRNMETNDR